MVFPGRKIPLIIIPIFFLIAIIACEEKKEEEPELLKLKHLKDENIARTEKAVEMRFDRSKNVKRNFELKICSEIQIQLDQTPPYETDFELQQQKNRIAEEVARNNYIPVEQVDSIWRKFSGESIYDPTITSQAREEIGVTKKPKEKKKRCPENMAFIGLFCIDLYEYPNIRGAIPEGGYPWFKAQAKCAEMGKRLCTESEWLIACTGYNDLNFPYGNNYKDGICRTAVPWEEGPSKSGSHPECISDYGVYDMSGNLAEWVGEKDSLAVVKGGYWEERGAFVSCKSYRHTSPSKHFKYLGFRCCMKPE